MVSNQEFNDWLMHPVTRAYFDELADEEQALSWGLSQGAYLNDPNEKLYMGYVRALREAINPENIRENIVEDNE